MTALSARLLRRAAIATGCAAAVLAASGFAPALASPGSHTAAHKVAPVVPGSRYLALGDSVTFGYREENSIPAPNDAKPKSIVGYPEDIGKNLDLKVANAACPGETTGSFLDVTTPSNGCETGYRAAFPLHVKYQNAAQSQLAYAEAYLTKYPDTRLVSLMIGANDTFQCLAQTTDGCQSEFPALQAKITKNTTKIFKGLRNTAHYTGQIVVLTYYSTDYSDFLASYESQGLNSAVEAAAKPYNVEIADGYGQFKKAARQGNGNVCTAQLLTVLSGADAGTCGVHPSLAGQALLAQAVEQAIKQ